MVEEGFLQKLDMSRLPNLQYINPKFKDLWWDPTDEYQVPKDYGTTGILYRTQARHRARQSWQEFYELIKGEDSGKTVFVDSMGDVFVVPAQDARLLAQLGRSGASSRRPRQILLDVAPHILALDSDKYGDKIANGRGVADPGLDRAAGQELHAEPGDRRRRLRRSRPKGTLFWLDTGSCSPTRRTRTPRTPGSNFIHEPEIQAEETNYNLYATPNDAAKEFVDPEILNDPAVFPPDDVIAKLEGAEDTSGNHQRIDIWEEFKSKIGG